MMETANSEINVEDLMRRIRQEVAQRKAQSPPAPEAAVPSTPYTQTVVALPRLPENKECVANKTDYSLAELLSYDDDCFVRSAYLAILRRAPDAAGCAHYLHMLRTGQLSKAEILGRLRYSPEGKACATAVHGLLLPFAVQSTYRIPVLGYGVALANFLLRLPVIIRNRVNFEASTLRQQREQVAQINALAAQIERALSEKAGNSELAALASKLEAIRSSAVPRQDVETLQQQVLELCSKAETAVVEARMEILGQKAATAKAEALAAQTEAVAAQTEVLAAQTEFLAAQTEALAAQTEALAAQTRDKVLSLIKAVETKADNERLTQLTNHLVELMQRKTDATKLTTAVTRLGEELAQKAAVVQVETLAAQTHALATQTTEKLLGLQQVMDTKAAVTQLEALATQTNEQIHEITQAIQTKASADELAGTATRLGEGLAQKADAATTQQATREIQRQILDHKHNILDQQRRLALLLEEARKRLPEPISTEQITNMVAEEDHLLDAFYVSFEDRFRGTREDIKQRTSVYLPVVKEAEAGTKNAHILDVGCGRGEWLELLRENDLVARGVDLNRVMVSQCQELGLEVTETDAIACLRGLKANSLGAVTGMHIIEHIPFKRLIALFDEVLRVLKPGGVAIFETPNPENLIVGACNFYYDPTHLNPLPPEPMKFVMESRGFARVEIMRLHPQPESAMLREGSAQVQQIVNGLMFGAQDYALVAYKSLG